MQYPVKLSISLSETSLHFIKKYQKAHKLKNHSEVICEALKLLQEKELQQQYRAASAEIDPAWESTASDGLDSH